MKKNLFTLFLIFFAVISATAQNTKYKPAIPKYGDPKLVEVIKDYYRKEKNGDSLPKNVSREAYRDTVNSIFSQFSVAKGNLSKNINLLSAEIATKETRLSYNAAIYGTVLKVKGIYNAEIFASGKDNLANLFGKGKAQGKFGLNLSGSFIMWSTKFYRGKEAVALHQKRLDYAWALQDDAKLLSDTVQKNNVESEIKSLKKQLEDSDISGYKSKHEIFAKITKLEDSLKKFISSGKRKEFYEDALTAYDKKNAKWTGFRLWTLDVKAGIANEGYSHYTNVTWPNLFPDISENAYRFNRWNFNAAVNNIVNISWLSNKASAGLGIASYTGFDGQAPDEIVQSTNYSLENVNRSIEKKYSAYAFKPELVKEYLGVNFTFNEQFLIGKRKSMGLGFTHSTTYFTNGIYKGAYSIDHIYSLLFSLGKKDELMSRNVLAINLTTPDLQNDLPKSRDRETNELLGTRKKMEIGITFGLAMEKVFGK